MDHPGIGRQDGERAERERRDAEGSRRSEGPRGRPGGALDGADRRAGEDEHAPVRGAAERDRAAAVVGDRQVPANLAGTRVPPDQASVAQRDEQVVGDGREGSPRALPERSTGGRVEGAGGVLAAGDDAGARPEDPGSGRAADVGHGHPTEGDPPQPARSQRVVRDPGRRGEAQPAAAPGRLVACSGLPDVGERRPRCGLEVGEERVVALPRGPGHHDRAEVRRPVEDGLGEGQRIAVDGRASVDRHGSLRDLDPGSGAPSRSRHLEGQRLAVGSHQPLGGGAEVPEEQERRAVHRENLVALGGAEGDTPADEEGREIGSRSLPGGEPPLLVVELEAAGRLARPPARPAGAGGRDARAPGLPHRGAPGGSPEEALDLRAVARHGSDRGHPRAEGPRRLPRRPLRGGGGPPRRRGRVPGPGARG